MGIKTDFEHMDLNFTDCYAKVAKLVLINFEPKKWQCIMSYHSKKDGQLVKTGRAFSFPYSKGADPMEQAYDACGLDGEEV